MQPNVNIKVKESLKNEMFDARRLWIKVHRTYSKLMMTLHFFQISYTKIDGENKHILKTQIIKVQRRISLFYLWSATEVKLQSRISQKWSFRGMCVVFELKFTGISYSYSKWMMTHFFFTQIRKSTRKNTILKCK